MKVDEIFKIFELAISAYHIENKIDHCESNPYPEKSLENLLFLKSYIDTIQWHCEDEVRHPEIEPEQVRVFKNKIDQLNQTRTNLVEQLDDFLLNSFKDINPLPNPRLNTESPAWAIDRLSILALKIYHMKIESERSDLSPENALNYQAKYQLLLTQKSDLILAIENLFLEIKRGETIYKLYRQVKMYNDSDLNPVLRKVK